MIGPYERNTIHCGDARELAKAIPDNTFDMVFTDPPYLKEDIPLYSWLFEESSRVLKPGGFLFAYTSGYYLPQVYAAIEGRGLDYHWQMALVHTNGDPRVWGRRLMSGYKPILIYVKPPAKNPPWLATRLLDRNPDKRYHAWQQSIHFPLYVFERFNGRLSTVWEPFAGSGTTCVAALLAGLNYLAFESDPDTADLARERVRNTQPPLFVLEPEQMELAI